MAITCNGGASGIDGIPLLTDITNSTFAINETLTFSATAGEVITSTAISFQDPLDTGIPDDSTAQNNITFSGEGTTVITVGANWNDPFNDQFTYVEQGQSDRTQTPSVVQSINLMPSGKVLYNLDQDNTEYVTKGLFVTVTYDSGQVNFFPEVRLYNPWERMRSFISNYYT